MQVSQAGLVPLRVPQDLQTHPHQLLPLQLHCPLLLGRLGLVVVEIEEPLGLALDAALQFLGDVRGVRGRRLEEEIGDGCLLVGEHLVDGVRGGFGGGVFEFGVGDVESECEHAVSEDAVPADIVGEAVEVGADLLGNAWDLEELVSGDVVVAQQTVERAGLIHLRPPRPTCTV